MVGLGPLDALFDGADDAGDFLLGDRHRLGAGAQEARHLRGVLDEVVGLVGELHLHQHVAREELALGVDLAAAADLDDVLGRHQDVGEVSRRGPGSWPARGSTRPPSSRSSSRRGRCTTCGAGWTAGGGCGFGHDLLAPGGQLEDLGDGEAAGRHRPRRRRSRRAPP